MAGGVIMVRKEVNWRCFPLCVVIRVCWQNGHARSTGLGLHVKCFRPCSACVCVPTGLCSAGNRCHMSSMHAHLHEQLYSCSSSRPAGSTASGMHDILALQEFEKGTPVKCNPLAWWTFKDCFEYLDRRELAVQASVAAQPHCMHFTRLTCCARCTRMLDEASSDGLLPCYLRHDAEQMQGAAEVARLLMTHSTVMHTWNLPSAPCPYGAGIIKVSHTCA